MEATHNSMNDARQSLCDVGYENCETYAVQFCRHCTNRMCDGCMVSKDIRSSGSLKPIPIEICLICEERETANAKAIRDAQIRCLATDGLLDRYLGRDLFSGEAA